MIHTWEAEFEDGSVIEQGDDDEYARAHGGKGNRFMEVLEKQKTCALNRFTLKGTATWSVFLPVGLFVNDVSRFMLHLVTDGITDKELIYTKVQGVPITIGAEFGVRWEPKQITYGSPIYKGCRLGWKGKLPNGEEIERFIFIPA